MSKEHKKSSLGLADSENSTKDKDLTNPSVKPKTVSGKFPDPKLVGTAPMTRIFYFKEMGSRERCDFRMYDNELEKRVIISLDEAALSGVEIKGRELLHQDGLGQYFFEHSDEFEATGQVRLSLDDYATKVLGLDRLYKKQRTELYKCLYAMSNCHAEITDPMNPKCKQIRYLLHAEFDIQFCPSNSKDRGLIKSGTIILKSPPLLFKTSILSKNLFALEGEAAEAYYNYRNNGAVQIGLHWLLSQIGWGLKDRRKALANYRHEINRLTTPANELRWKEKQPWTKPVDIRSNKIHVSSLMTAAGFDYRPDIKTSKSRQKYAFITPIKNFLDVLVETGKIRKWTLEKVVNTKGIEEEYFYIVYKEDEALKHYQKQLDEIKRKRGI